MESLGHRGDVMALTVDVTGQVADSRGHFSRLTDMT